MKPKLFWMIQACSLFAGFSALAETVAYWRFEEGPADANVSHGGQADGVFYQGTADSSGNGNGLSVWAENWAGFAFKTDRPFTMVPRTGAANNFAVVNTGGYPAMFTNSTTMRAMTPAAWTIEASFKPENGNYRTIVGRDSRGANTQGADANLAALYFQIIPGNALAIKYTDVSGYWHEAVSAAGAITGYNWPNSAAGVWHQAAAVCDGTTLSLYLRTNGAYALVASTNLTTSGSPNTAMSAGTGTGGGWTAGDWTVGRGLYAGNHVDRGYGYIDEVRISNTALAMADFLGSADPDDADFDGLPTSWEIAFGLDPNDNGSSNVNNGASGDPDGDGFSNLEEFEAGSLPDNINSVPGDVDGDGMDDLWETTHFGNTSRGPTEDPDGDHANNLAESLNSTVPTNGTSWPDTDTDGLNDAWESIFLGSLALDGSADTDGDGFTDLQEHDAHTDPSLASGAGASPVWASLKHRWSFNGNLNDSVGASNATVVEVGGNDVFQGPSSILLTGGDKAASDYVSLGSNLLPKSTTPVTIELWARQNSILNWSRIFDFHSSTNESLMMSWTRDANTATDRVEFKDDAAAITMDDKNQPYGTTNEQHIVLTLEPLAGTNGATRVTVYSAAAGAADLGTARSVGETTANLVNFVDTLDALGYSPWPDNTANATYNEVRIWNGALFGWMREKLHDQGPDNAAIPDAEASRDFLPDDWELQYFADTATATSFAGDNDSDTFSNLDEYIAGSNPNNNLVTPDDLDGDGLADAWETIYFPNIAAQNGSGDPDADGLTNEQEETAGSNPTDDEDGLLAAWEVFYFGSTATQNGTDDSDGDGVSNLDEHLKSQPNNIASTPTDVNGDGIADTLQHVLAAGDALGTASFDTGLNWNDTLAPATGETYIVAVDALRTPAADGDYTFAGARLDLLDVYTGLPRVVIKGTGTVTLPFITLNGGEIQHAAANGTTCRVAGAVDIRGPVRSMIGAPNGPLAVDAVISGSGNLELWGANTVTFTAANTYTGNIKNWTTNGFILAATGSLKFVPGATGVNNSISGTGPVTLNGAFDINLGGAGSTIGDTWDLVTSTGTVTIGTTFSVTGFTATGTAGARIWRSGTYQFDEATGILSVSANPDSDTDGMDDAWEATWFGGLAQGAGDDFDADGTDNLTEYRLGLIPASGTSVFAATRNETTGQLTWPSVGGLTFRIERSTTLGSWTALETACPAAASPATSTTYTDGSAPAGKAFYRIGLNP